MIYRSQASASLLFILFLFSACRFNPNVQKSGSPAFQGIWEEAPLPFKDSLLLNVRHTFKFTCDSFYVNIESFSKVNYHADSCFKGGNWKEYAKGNYVIREDTLYMVGAFTHANYKQKLSGCYRTGVYNPKFLIRKTESEKIELVNIHQHLPMSLMLKEKITCNPQPL